MQGTKVLKTAIQGETAQTAGQSSRHECEVCGRTMQFKNVLKKDSQDIVLCKKHFRQQIKNL